MIANNRLGIASGEVGIEDNVSPGKHAGHGAVSSRRFGLIMELRVLDPRHISSGVEFNAGDPEIVTGFIYMRSSRRVDPLRCDASTFQPRGQCRSWCTTLAERGPLRNDRITAVRGCPLPADSRCLGVSEWLPIRAAALYAIIWLVDRLGETAAVNLGTPLVLAASWFV
jgi:hypothetical protein